MPSLPSNGAWMLSAGPHGEIPPFVKLEVDFDAGAGAAQGMQRSQLTLLTGVKETSPGNFTATYPAAGGPVTFTASLAQDGGLTLSFSGTSPMTCTARPITVDWDAGTAGIGSQKALALVAQFEKDPQPGKFVKIDRKKVAFGLRMTIRRPEDAIAQNDNNLCGPASFMYALAKHDIASYTQYVIDLYDDGFAFVGPAPLGFDRWWKVTPSAALRTESVPASFKNYEASWIALASLRDSENLFAYHAGVWFEGQRGGTTAAEMANWCRLAGFTQVVEQAKSGSTIAGHADLQNLLQADQYYRGGYKVFLCVYHKFSDRETDRSVRAKGGGLDHFLVLASQIEVGARLRMKFFNPAGAVESLDDLTPNEFLNSYYGFVAARR